MPLPDGIGERQPRGLERQFALPRLHVAREHGAVGALLHLDAVGVDVDRRIAVMALERRHLAARLRDRRPAEGQAEQRGDQDEYAVMPLI